MGVVLLESLNLPAKQEQAVRLLIKGQKITDIGRALGMKKAAASRLLSRARQSAAAKGVSLPTRPRKVRARSLPDGRFA